MNNKEKLRKETLKKVNSLQLGMQEPLFSEYSKFKDLKKLAMEIHSNLVNLEIETIKEEFNNFNKKEDDKKI